MVSKSEIKSVQSLKLKKFRQKYNLFVAEGDKTVRTLLSHGRFKLHQLYAASTWNGMSEIKGNPGLVKNCTKEELKKLSLLTTPTSAIGIFNISEENPAQIRSAEKIIFLDDIQDPGNLGTIIRIADWYGIDMVIRSEGSADFFNPKVVQATMGSLGHVQMCTITKKDFPDLMNEFQIIGASVSSDKVPRITNAQKICLVIGNEGHGISEEIDNCLDHRIQIPGAVNRAADSLNAAIATGILCQMLFGASLK